MMQQLLFVISVVKEIKFMQVMLDKYVSFLHNIHINYITTRKVMTSKSRCERLPRYSLNLI